MVLLEHDDGGGGAAADDDDKLYMVFLGFSFFLFTSFGFSCLDFWKANTVNYLPSSPFLRAVVVLSVVPCV